MILVDYLIAKYPYIASDLPIIYKNNVLLYDCEANYELEFIERREKINNNLYDIVKTYNNKNIYIYSNNSYIVNSSINLNSILIYNNKYIHTNVVERILIDDCNKDNIYIQDNISKMNYL